MILFTRTKQKYDMPDLEEFMTTQEAAEKLGFHVKSIPSMMKDKELDGIRFGKVWLVSRKSVQEYLEKTKGMSKNDPRRKNKK
jgi:excisionase family DNA binding protein